MQLNLQSGNLLPRRHQSARISRLSEADVQSAAAAVRVRPASPYSQAALRHQSGIHVNGFLRDPDSYHIFPHANPEIWFGKCSGSSNFQYLFEKQLNKPLTPEDYNQMRDKIKSLSIQEQRCFSPEEVVELFEGGFFKD